jgi:hypothetical protein
MMYAIEMGPEGMIYIPRFMRSGIGILEVSRFCLRNLRGCNVLITDGRDLLITPL